MKIWKKWFTVLAAALLCVALLGSVQAEVAEVSASGTIGTNLTWTLENGVLTVSGEGTMKSKPEEWSSYSYAITKIVIEEGVTSICSNAFESFGLLESVELPGTLKIIGDFAFYYCGKLGSVSIPSSVTTIGNCAFQGTGLTQVTVPSTVKSIGYSVFACCDDLTKAVIETKYLDSSSSYSMFYSCKNLESVSLADGITVIPQSMFAECASLTSVTLPSKVTLIEWAAFQKSGLTGISIPSGVTSIGGNAFAGTMIKSVTIPENVYITDGAFDGCYELASVSFPKHVTISSNAFKNCEALRDVALSCGANVDKKAFVGCDGLTIHTGEGTTAFECAEYNGIAYVIEEDLGHDLQMDEAHMSYFEVPTCTKAGRVTYFCTRCENWVGEFEVPAKGHDFENGWVEYIKLGTCTEDGLAYWHCANGCDLYEERVIPASGHDLVNGYWDETVYATCTEPGHRVWHCGSCGEATELEEDIPAYGEHEMYYSYTTEASCEQEGYEQWYCSRCGYEEKRNVVPALGHDLENGWFEARTAYCEEDGWGILHCARCGYSEEGMIPAQGHEYNSYYLYQGAQCMPGGTERADCVHGWTDDKGVWHSCTAYTERPSESEPVAHEVDKSWSNVILEPKLNCEGIRAYYCRYGCGTVMETESIPKLEKETGGYDAIGPELTTVKISKNSVIAPGYFDVTIDAKDDMGLQSADIGLRKVGGGNGDTNHAYGGLWNDEWISGEGVFRVYFDNNKIPGTWEIEYINLCDVMGNWSYYWNTGNGYLESEFYAVDMTNVSMNFEVINDEISKQLLLDNPDIVNQVAELGDGDVAKIMVRNNTVAKADIFNAIVGKNVTLTFYKDAYQWTINGMDIDPAKVKDIDLEIEIWDVPGIDYGSECESILMINFRDNGELPGKMTVRLKADIIADLHALDKPMMLYYLVEGVDPELVEGNVDYILDNTDHWCKFDITHNSSYLLSAGELGKNAIESITLPEEIESGVLVLKKGATYKLEIPEDPDHELLKYKSSKTSAVKVSADGVITAKKKGTATVTVSAKDNPDLKVTFKVTVGSPVTKVTLNKTSTVIKKGKSVTLKATLTPSKPSVKTLKWTSSNPKIATVDQNGKVIAKKNGTCTITCTTTDGTKLSASCKITVGTPITKLKISKKTLSLKKGKTATLKVTITPSKASVKKLEWKSSNTKIAKVDQNGKVTAVKPGTCIITCSATDGSGLSVTCKVTVKKK